MTQADWIAVDWGTSRLRAWAMASDGDAMAEASSDDGMSKLARADFEAALLGLIEPWLGKGVTPVLACGMVGARQGWHEVSYVPVPVRPAGLRATQVTSSDPRIAVSILPGLSQAAPADVMRGEETQIAGILADDPAFDGVICLPGTHCKWVRVSAEEVVSFQTAMTGELFDLVLNHSVIRHVLPEGRDDTDAFLEAVSDMLSKPETLSQRLFAIRAEAVLTDVPSGRARSQLSGLLIGSELAATRAYWLGQRVAVAAERPLSELYGRALAAQGVAVEVRDAEPLTRRGLAAAFAGLSEVAR